MANRINTEKAFSFAVGVATILGVLLVVRAEKIAEREDIATLTNEVSHLVEAQREFGEDVKTILRLEERVENLEGTVDGLEMCVNGLQRDVSRMQGALEGVPSDNR